MPTSKSSADLPQIPTKLYFTISEVSILCGVNDHTLRYWEEGFAGPLPKVDRRNGRRRYQKEHILVFREIRSLLRDRGLTIAGALKLLKEDERGQTQEQASFGQSSILVSELREIRRLLTVAQEELSGTNL